MLSKFYLLKKFLQNKISATVEFTWGLGFRLFGLMANNKKPSKQVSSGNERVLVVAPHPDDEVIGCAGTILHHLACGDCVWVVCVTDGRGSRAFGLPPQEMAKRRSDEIRQVAQFLKLDNLIWFGLPECEWQSEDLASLLQKTLQNYQPTLIYAPTCIDFHPEHYKVACTLANILQPGPEVRGYQIHVPLTHHLSNLVVDVSNYKKQINDVLSLYKTQQWSIPCALRWRYYSGCFYGNYYFIEPFWAMSVDTYQSLHTSTKKTWSTNSFRGLRLRPFTDPLAYWQGWLEKKQLAQQFEYKKT